jgi:uncharacterized membrane protein YfcA
MVGPELAEQLSAIERAQASAREAASRSARWNGVYLALTGIFLGAFAGNLGHAYAPALVMAVALCLIAFAIWGPRLRGTARRQWRRASLVALVAGLVFYVAGFSSSGCTPRSGSGSSAPRPLSGSWTRCSPRCRR